MGNEIFIQNKKVCVQPLTNRLEALIRLLSLFEYILDESGTAENKVEVLFSHDKLLLTSILRPLHQVTPTVISSVPTKINITTNYHCQHLSPLLVPPSPPTHSSPTVHLGGGASYFSLILSTMVSICIHLPTTPSLYLHIDLQWCHLGKFLYNILLD